MLNSKVTTAMRQRARSGGVLLALAAALVAVPLRADPPVDPSLWPKARSTGLIFPETEAQITALMAKMTLAEKVGQMIQADIGAIRPEDLRSYPLGSILAGGSSPPLDAPDRSPLGPWLKSSQAFRAVSTETRPGHQPIPIIFGIDAVHGNSNVVGAVVFPHNIGLGAAHDPDLMRRIGRVTAVETAITGIEWSFGPTLAVPQDDRWGRTYEGYSERPEISKAYARAMVLGLQGEPGKGRIQNGDVAASAKHFLGDGGTTDGIDQGDTAASEAELIALHAQGYPQAIDAGVMTVMASYNSWLGTKMHGNRALLTDVLKGRMGFDGFVVSDWNGHAQIPGCSNTSCPQAFNAGIDMLMAPDGWKALFDATLAQAKDGTIPMARIDDAVRRILRVKLRLGLFDPARPYEARPQLMGSPEHRAVAREAVRKSLVLLKNNGNVLPLRSGARVLVAGSAATDIGQQTGGWTLSWQGTGNQRSDFPNGETIYEGIAAALKAGGGSAQLSVDGSFTTRPDAAIVIFGEPPYAEMRGDIKTLEFEAGDKVALATLRKLKAAGIPVVSVFLSGRPLWVNPELNASDAFVAAWLPGSEGGGVADVIIGDGAGKPRHDFTGRLSFSWPRTAGQFRLNAGQPGYDPLFALDYGLTYASRTTVATLPEVAGVDPGLANSSIFFARGRTPAPFSLHAGPGVTTRAVDARQLQEGAVEVRWSAPGSFAISGPPLDLSREANADLSLQIEYRVDTAPAAAVMLGMTRDGGKPVDVSSLFSGAPGQWRTVKVKLRCLAGSVPLTKVSAPFVLSATAPFKVSIADLRLVSDPEGSLCPGG